ncbi:MAG: hypothetical protein M3280_00090 [Actinomycetota bacterium]|nr:hypothetical protein [Actinomycetota bacterium]
MKRRVSNVRALGLVAGVGLLLSGMAAYSGIAHAHDHDAPIVRLRAERLRQDGVPREIWWVDRTDDKCVGWNEVGPGDFPSAMEVVRGEKARISFQKHHRPMEVSITEWRGIRVGEDVLLGSPEQINFVLKRRKGNDGSTLAWDAVFQRPGPGEYFYEAFAEWPDRQGCGSGQGGYWRFSLSIDL